MEDAVAPEIIFWNKVPLDYGSFNISQCTEWSGMSFIVK